MLVIGCLSGTSMNAKEFILCEIKKDKIKPINYFSEKYDEYERSILKDITIFGGDVQKIATAHDLVGISFSSSLKKFLENNLLKKNAPEIIGFHGQTIFHSELSRSYIKHQKLIKTRAITLQIGEPAFLARISQKPVVYDFRKIDISAGGRGAPLSPLIHYILFKKYDKKVCVLNLGGIANISIIQGENFSQVRGFDVGPANALCDHIAKIKLKTEYDPEGRYAREGKILERDFSKLYRIFKTKSRSLGVEVEKAKIISEKIFKDKNPKDSLRTALEVSVRLITDTINKIRPNIVILCGGGVRNKFFVERISEESKTKVILSDELGMKAEYVEPILFAFLSYLRIRNIRINMQNITGAKVPYLPGKICTF